MDAAAVVTKVCSLCGVRTACDVSTATATVTATIDGIGESSSPSSSEAALAALAASMEPVDLSALATSDWYCRGCCTGPATGKALVGRPVSVHWEADRAFYAGTVTAFEPVSGKHLVTYADGEWEYLYLASHRVVYAPPSLADGFFVVHHAS